MSHNKNNGLITKTWGPSTWISMHSISFGYPIKPTDQHKKNYGEYFKNVENILPCKYCRDSYKQFIQEDDTKLEDFLGSRKKLTYWVYLIHEKVNKKLGINYGITFADVEKRYETYRAQCSSSINKIAKGCIVPLNKKKNSFQVLNQKDCPIIDYELAKKFISYAQERGFSKDEMSLLKNIKYHQLRKDNVWENRNNYCEKIIKKMRNKGISSIEESGKYKGFPTIHELTLILNLCSNIPNDQLKEISIKLK